MMRQSLVFFNLQKSWVQQPVIVKDSPWFFGESFAYALAVRVFVFAGRGFKHPGY